MCVCLFCWASCFSDVHIFGKVRHGLRATTKRHAVMSSRGARGERVYSQTHARMNAWMYAQKYTCTYIWRCWWKTHFYKRIPWSKECSSQKKVELRVLNCDLHWRAFLQAHTPPDNHLSYSLYCHTCHHDMCHRGVSGTWQKIISGIQKCLLRNLVKKNSNKWGKSKGTCRNWQAILYQLCRFSGPCLPLLPPWGDICFGHKIQRQMMEVHLMITGTKRCHKQLNERSLTD